MTKTMMHVDINSYFATLTQQTTPPLRGKPVAIVKDIGRSCVIAASKEAKQFGIKTGCLLSEAQARCPQIVVMPADFDWYLAATRKLKALFESFSPDVEIFSLDETFIDFTPLRQHYDSPIDFGKQIQAKIKQDIGEWVTCNVGISCNRFLAKMASETAGPDSITHVTHNTKDALLARVTFKDTCGIGMRLEARLARLGVTHPYQINFIEDATLQAQFGPYWAIELRKMGRGEEPAFLSRINHNPHMKSVGRSITGYKLCKTEEAMKRVLYNLTEEVMYKVRQMKLAGRHVSLYLVGSHSRAGSWGGPRPGKEDYRSSRSQSWGTQITLPYYIRQVHELFHVLYDELFVRWEDRFPVIKFGIRLSQLKPWSEVPQILWPEWHKRESLATAIDNITQKHGLFTVTSGLLVNSEIIRPEVTGFFGDQKFQFMD